MPKTCFMLFILFLPQPIISIMHTVHKLHLWTGINHQLFYSSAIHYRPFYSAAIILISTTTNIVSSSSSSCLKTKPSFLPLFPCRQQRNKLKLDNLSLASSPGEKRLLRHQLSSDNMSLSPFSPVPNVKIQDTRMSSSAEDFLSRRGSSGIGLFGGYFSGKSRSVGRFLLVPAHYSLFIHILVYAFHLHRMSC